MSDNDWTTKTWQVNRDSNVGLLAGDWLSFPAPGGNGIQVQNRSFVWGTGCTYEDDSRARVTYAGETYLVERSGDQLTCTPVPAPAPDPAPISLLGFDPRLPVRGARRKAQATAEARCEFPILTSPPPSSWTATEGGGGQP